MSDFDPTTTIYGSGTERHVACAIMVHATAERLLSEIFARPVWLRMLTEQGGMQFAVGREMRIHIFPATGRIHVSSVFLRGIEEALPDLDMRQPVLTVEMQDQLAMFWYKLTSENINQFRDDIPFGQERHMPDGQRML